MRINEDIVIASPQESYSSGSLPYASFRSLESATVQSEVPHMQFESQVLADQIGSLHSRASKAILFSVIDLLLCANSISQTHRAA